MEEENSCKGNLENQHPPRVLVTGGAGYIGQAAAYLLKQAGFYVVVLDNLVNGHREVVEDVLKIPLYVGEMGDIPFVENILRQEKINSVMHFSAYCYVGESVKNPALYYQNNVSETLKLLDAMRNCGVKKIVFSSTCATYGNPKKLPLMEDHPQEPINAYGTSKLMVEQILKDYETAYGLHSASLRYFNAAGAHPESLFGECHVPETHLIPLVIDSALKGSTKNALIINGGDYPTDDGTCVRDYVHILDLAEAHLLALQYLFEEEKSIALNLGSEKGYSILEVINMVEKITEKKVNYQFGERRSGDPAVLVADSRLAYDVLNWKTTYSLEDIIRHAYAFHLKRLDTSL